MSPKRWAFSPETYTVAARRDARSEALARLSLKCEETVSEDVAGTLTVRHFAGSFTAERLAAPPQIILTMPPQETATRGLALSLDGSMQLARGDHLCNLAPNAVVFGGA